MTPFLAALLSWYIAVFAMSMFRGYYRYREFRKNRLVCTTTVIVVSLIWPFVIPFILFGIPLFVFFVSLWGVLRNGHDYLTIFMDNVVRRVMK